jgi:hypothetical protein
MVKLCTPVLAPREPDRRISYEIRNQGVDSCGRCGGCRFRACRSHASIGWWADSDVQPLKSQMHKTVDSLPRGLALLGKVGLCFLHAIICRRPHSHHPRHMN